MQIKQQALAQQLQKKIAPLYLLLGSDNYLLDEALTQIKSTLKKSTDCDEKILSIQSTEDWNALTQEANSYSLFSDTLLLTVFYDKKTIDAKGKKALTQYLDSINTRSFIVISAPNLPVKQVAWLTGHPQVVVVVAYPMTDEAMQSWVGKQLIKNSLSFDTHVPQLIVQYTQGNMLACAQVLEKIALTYPINAQITAQQALEQLSDQCEHSLYDLVEACLQGQPDKAIQILRQASNNKTESILVLWMLTQEVRTLLQLSALVHQGMEMKMAAGRLKIWPQRVSLYSLCIKRLNYTVLQPLLHYCQTIDERIKSHLNTQTWNSLENLALSLCLGQLVGDSCAV